MDFGRITLDQDLILYLFGTPGQDRFWFMWDDLVRGAIGAVVLVDTRRLADCFPAVDYFENSGLPFVIALNGFDGAQPYQPEEVREALQIGPDTPIITTDARHRADAKSALITLVEHALMARLRVVPTDARRKAPHRTTRCGGLPCVVGGRSAGAMGRGRSAPERSREPGGGWAQRNGAFAGVSAPRAVRRTAPLPSERGLVQQSASAPAVRRRGSRARAPGGASRPRRRRGEAVSVGWAAARASSTAVMAASSSGSAVPFSTRRRLAGLVTWMTPRTRRVAVLAGRQVGVLGAGASRGT
ncbi:hypothetical protein STANM309S_05786 [Streptomyces tanashiensis]